jgi:hypothetical protein
VALAAFVAIERRSTAPMPDLRLPASRSVARIPPALGSALNWLVAADAHAPARPGADRDRHGDRRSGHQHRPARGGAFALLAAGAMWNGGADRE